MKSDPNYSIAGVQGPIERKLSQESWERKRAELLRDGDDQTHQALIDYDAAMSLYENGKYAEAEAAFTQVVKGRRKLHESFWVKFRKAWGAETENPTDMYGTYGDAIEEDALFMVAESQFSQKKYAHAEKNYQELLGKYPSTRYLDPTTRQLFRIARYWLDFPEDEATANQSQIQVAGHETTELGKIEEPIRKPSVTSRVPVLPNLSDRSRPTFDTYGAGKRALRAIWLNDSTGPLADDALMLAANHALRTEDYVEAARLYALLREQYPDSPHIKDAYLLGSHVTLASYLGPAYDGKSLETSRELKEDMLAMFPELTQDQRSQLEDEVNRLKEAEIQRLWDLVEFYQAKRMYPAIKLHCYLILNRHPDSKYAEPAREKLREVERKEQEWANSPWNLKRNRSIAATAPAQPSTPVAPQQSAQTEAESGQTPARVKLPEPEAAPAVLPEPQQLTEPEAKPRLLPRLFPSNREEEPAPLSPPNRSVPKSAPEVESDSNPFDPTRRANFEN
ncbi:tetratricopeptide repeat protein [Planctomicrobium sp. SH668]|uniref:tetratricopeptide repeat protein n=1 Tax=Planctomicrobium sp. SH668 TaxID=3448126 RepID=UPI003F5C95E2